MSLTRASAAVIKTEEIVGTRNRIINGAMEIDQRNAGAAVTTAQSFPVDRFVSLEGLNGYTTLSVSAQQSTDAPTTFRNSVKVTINTGQSITASRYFLAADHRIEGFNFADFGFGTSSAQPFTLSFWVKSSVTGTYPVSFFNTGATRAYLATYTVNSANTWEYKTITVVGDTTGTWNTTNDVGLGMQFAISGGSDSFGTAGSWSGTYKRGVSGMADVASTTGATFYITGVQLEVGSVATPFERRPFGTELALCQRYCYVVATAGGYSTYGTTGQFVSTTRVDFPILFPTYMRASPTGTYTAANTYLPSSAGADFTPSAVASVAGSASSQAITVSFTVSGATAGRAATLTDLNTATSKMTFSAEL
jgi:hypothetical protein